MSRVLRDFVTQLYYSDVVFVLENRKASTERTPIIPPTADKANEMEMPMRMYNSDSPTASSIPCLNIPKPFYRVPGIKWQILNLVNFEYADDAFTLKIGDLTHSTLKNTENRKCALLLWTSCVFLLFGNC